MSDLLKAASAALVLLHSIQEKEEGACSMPWPEIDALEQAVSAAKEQAQPIHKALMSKVAHDLTVSELIARLQFGGSQDVSKQVRFVGPDDVLLRLDGFEDRPDKLLVIFTQGDCLFWQEQEEARPAWIDRHSITCAICGELADEREASRNDAVEGEICRKCTETSKDSKRSEHA